MPFVEKQEGLTTIMFKAEIDPFTCGGHIDGGGRSGRRRIAPNCSDPGRANSEAVGGVICK